MTNDPRQTSLPGTAPDTAGHLRQRANETLRPARPQAPCDVGLFGDGPAQIDLIDFINQQRG